MDTQNKTLRAFLTQIQRASGVKEPIKQATRVDFERADQLARLAWVLDESAAVERAIDDLFQQPDWRLRGALLDTLARAEVGWTHPTILEGLERDETRSSAAFVAARGMPLELDEWLDSCEVADDGLEAMRAVALAGEVGRAADWPGFLAWHDAIMELDGAKLEKQRASAALAALDPTYWARHTLAGDSDESWLEDVESVADFLIAHGLSEWTEVFASFDIAPGTSLGANFKAARDFAALLAVAAAIGISGREHLSEAEARELIAFFEISPDTPSERWEGRVGRAGLAGCLALLGGELEVAGDEGLALLLVQVAAHQRLLAHGFHSPGIPGLPFSASDRSDIDVEMGEEIRAELLSYFEKDAAELEGQYSPAALVLVLRNLADLRYLEGENPQKFSPLIQKWRQSFDGLIGAEVMAYDARELAPGELKTQAQRGGVTELNASKWLAQIGGGDSAILFAKFWAQGELWRAGFYRNCVDAALNQDG